MSDVHYTFVVSHELTYFLVVGTASVCGLPCSIKQQCHWVESTFL